MTKIKSYTEMLKLKSFDERIEYLKCNTEIGVHDTLLNKLFYKSREWQRIRDYVIVRDGGCDLALPNFFIGKRAIVHHINPLTADDFQNNTSNLFDLDNLVCVSIDTHNYIHYGRYKKAPQVVERKPNDTSPWKA